MLRRLGGVDGIAAIVLLALGVLGWIEVADYPERAGIWPRWMLTGMMLLSALLLVQAIVSARRKSS